MAFSQDGSRLASPDRAGTCISGTRDVEGGRTWTTDAAVEDTDRQSKPADRCRPSPEQTASDAVSSAGRNRHVQDRTDPQTTAAHRGGGQSTGAARGPEVAPGVRPHPCRSL